MKTILFAAAGTVALLAAPAGAETAKRQSVTKKPATAVKVAEAARETPAPSIDAALATRPADGALAALPELPADLSSPLVPFPELERARPVAARAAKPVPQKAAVMKFGKDYVLGGRQSAKPTQETEHIVPKSLSQAQVATVVQDHMSDIQLCWNAVPKAQRVDACTANLQLSISDAGAVTDIEIGGDVPAAAQKCIISTVSHWTFPVAETRSEIEYGISLRSL